MLALSPAFWSGLGVGAGAAILVAVVIALLLLPESSGVEGRAGFAAVSRQFQQQIQQQQQQQQQQQSNDEKSSRKSGVQGRQARWAVRSENVHRLIGTASSSVVAGLKFADAACHFGFGIGIALTRLGFFLGRKSLHALDLFLAWTHEKLYERMNGDRTEHSSSAYGSASVVKWRSIIFVERLLRFFHFVDETVYYAQLITVFSLRTTKLIVRVALRGSLQMLQLYHFMSPKGAMQATLGAISSVCFEVQTLEALVEIANMVSAELLPVSLALRLPQINDGLAALSKFNCQGQNASTAAAICRVVQAAEAKKGIYVTQLDELEDGQDVERFVMFAVGMYGQMGLKFLGIVPYGSVSSDTQALAYCTRLENTNDVLVADFGGDIYLPGYAVCVDHAAETLVVTIRGSIQPLDFLSDLVCEPIEVSLMGVRGSAHKGMYRAAVNLDLKLRAVMADLLDAGTGKGARVSKEISQYRLVLTGHSLGAGAAVLLAALWLSGPDPLIQDRSSIKVYGFGTPQVVSSEIAHEMGDSVTTLIMGNDMVPRFSLQSFQRLRDRTLAVSLSAKPGQTPDQWESLMDTGSHVAQLVPPGVLIWVDDSALEHEDVQVLVSKDGDLSSDNFNDIIVSSDMFLAHLPQHYAILGDVPFPSSFV